MGTTVRGPWWGAALLVAACATACSGTAGHPAVETDYSHATVTEQHTIQVDLIGMNTRLVIPSPDGSKVYTVDDGQACIVTLADSQQVCARDGPSMPSTYWARWAPDSHAVAFTDDFRLTLHEPDLWVMDASDGRAKNLTDDGSTSVLGSDGPTPVLDLMPVWLDDSTILFARQQGRKSQDMALASVPADGGDVTELTRIGATISFLNAIAVQPGADAVAYTVATADQRSATVYLHPLGSGRSTATSTDRATTQAGATPSGRAAPPPNADPVLLHSDYDASLLSFSPDGQYLLADNQMAMSIEPSIKDPDAKVIRIDDGATTPVAKGSSAWYPTWSPTGHAIAFLSDVNGGTVQMVAEPGGSARPLTDKALDSPLNQRLTWTPNGLLVRSLRGITILTVNNG